MRYLYKTISYLGSAFVVFAAGAIATNCMIEHDALRLYLTTAFFGGMGGVAYCLTTICDGRWAAERDIWFFLRPIVGMFRGLFSCLAAKTIIFALEFMPVSDCSYAGFFVIALIAGMTEFRSIFEKLSKKMLELPS